ncbi:hypothetical protein [Streptomyces sp. NPDC058632]|uniref:hypothetical protein n=1 Tax=unclassified Streptomyces TaxID=2593676 RepID=UPI00364AB7EC
MSASMSWPVTAGGRGASEARFLTLQSPFGPGNFGISHIKDLPLDCLAGESSCRGSAIACATTPDDVLNELFPAPY